MVEQSIAEHYTHGALLEAIRAGLRVAGKSPATVSIDDLAPVDEFHIGGRRASEELLGQLSLGPDRHVLDVGCGLGGGARFAATRFGCRVTGIDLTPEYVETGRALCSWVGLGDRVSLYPGSALDLPFDSASFDAAYMMHVGMNIPDKETLFTGIARVLKPGGVCGVYDVMRTSDGELRFPVPWAETPTASAVATPDRYKRALHDAGLALLAERDRRGFALEFFAELAANTSAATGPPPLGLHLLMGDTRAEKLQNVVENIRAGRLAPVELIARKQARP